MSKKEYLFSCGNSSIGPIGFCASVNAVSKKEALTKIRAAMPDSWQISVDGKENPDVAYIQVYFNANAITMNDIEGTEVRDGHA